MEIWNYVNVVVELGTWCIPNNCRDNNSNMFNLQLYRTRKRHWLQNLWEFQAFCKFGNEEQRFKDDDWQGGLTLSASQTTSQTYRGREFHHIAQPPTESLPLLFYIKYTLLPFFNKLLRRYSVCKWLHEMRIRVDLLKHWPDHAACFVFHITYLLQMGCWLRINRKLLVSSIQ